MSPSLENIVTDFDRLHASTSRASPGELSTTGTPRTPASANAAERESQLTPMTRPKTYLIIGASRGIGLEFTRQLLLQQHQVIAVVRNPSTTASQLWQVTGSLPLRPGSCILEQCDVSSSADIDTFVSRMKVMVERGGNIDTIILNAGILEYDRGLGALNVQFEMLEKHLRVNCVGNVVLAQKLLMLNELETVKRRREYMQLQPDFDGQALAIGRQIIFMSSDSGSMADFREYEDGFAAYGASKVALNMMIRHMATELKRRADKKREESRNDWQSSTKDDQEGDAWEAEVCVLAMHPGEVSTDMGSIEVGWGVEGVITAEESVQCMLGVLKDKDAQHNGTFWRWDGTQHPW